MHIKIYKVWSIHKICVICKISERKNTHKHLCILLETLRNSCIRGIFFNHKEGTKI